MFSCFQVQNSPFRAEKQVNSKDDDDDVEIIIPDELPPPISNKTQPNTNREQPRSNQDHLKATQDRQNVGTLSDQSLQKRARFTEGQIRVLEQSFKKNAYPKKNEIERLSNWLEMSPKVIGVWFQNARQRAHKVTEDEDDDVEVILPDAVEAQRPLVASMEAQRPLVVPVEAQRPQEVNGRSLRVRGPPEKGTSEDEDSADPDEPGTQFNV